MKKNFDLVWLVLVSVLLSACATSVDRQYHLDRTLIVYEKTLRWGQFDAAMAFRKPDSELLRVPDGYDQVKVGEYNVQSAMIYGEGKKAAVVVEVGFFFSDSMKVKRVLDRQTWEYDDESGNWYITSPLPELR
jgi:hypothetical protein